VRTSIWLVRHVQTQYNREQRYQSHSNSPITAYGIRQQAALAHRLRRIPFTLALTTATERTQATAAAILAHRQLPVPTLIDPAWAESAHGTWEGLTYREVLQRYPTEARQRFADALHGRASGGEALADVAARVQQGWLALLREHTGERILIVTHATPIRIVLCSLTGMPLTQHWQWRIDLASITAIDIYASSPIIRFVNEVPRL